jgi:hypothetical protein
MAQRSLHVVIKSCIPPPLALYKRPLALPCIAAPISTPSSLYFASKRRPYRQNSSPPQPFVARPPRPPCRPSLTPVSHPRSSSPSIAPLQWTPRPKTATIMSFDELFGRQWPQSTVDWPCVVDHEWYTRSTSFSTKTNLKFPRKSHHFFKQPPWVSLIFYFSPSFEWKTYFSNHLHI